MKKIAYGLLAAVFFVAGIVAAVFFDGEKLTVDKTANNGETALMQKKFTHLGKNSDSSLADLFTDSPSENSSENLSTDSTGNSPSENAVENLSTDSPSDSHNSSFLRRQESPENLSENLPPDSTGNSPSENTAKNLSTDSTGNSPSESATDSPSDSHNSSFPRKRESPDSSSLRRQESAENSSENLPPDSTENSPSESAAKNSTEVLLVNFWATWCAPCLHEMPLFEETKPHLKNAKIVGIAIDREQAVKRFIGENNITYDIFIAKDDIFDHLKENGNPGGALPFSILADKNGKIIATKIGEFNSIGDIIKFSQQR